ncbi:Anillin [Taenia solium]|eukprot:TsM_000128600 transcript=TsM_000128600 gene=TsM_000128600
MDSSALKHKSSGDIDDNVSYVSKEKYTALANEIRKWEDDLRHTKHQKSRSRVLGGAEKTPAGKPFICHTGPRLIVAEILGGPYDQGNPELSPRKTSPPTNSGKRENFTVSGVSTCGRNSQTESLAAEDPELPPPPVGIEEPLAPAADIPVDLPPPPQIPDVEEDVHSKSAGFIDLAESPRREYFVSECPSAAQPVVSKHHYYNRPRLGAYAKSAGGGFSRGVLRNWPNCSNLNESPQVEAAKVELPRQRSVTFEPKPGSAPGDSEAEMEEEVPSVGTAASSAPSSFQVHSSVFNDAEERYKNVDGESLGILESVARLANSVDRLNRNSCSGLSSLTAAGKRTASSSGTEEVGGIGGGSSGCVSVSDGDNSDGESVNSEPTSNRPSLTAAGTIISPSSSRGRKSCDAQRRMSREASALLDFNCPPTPTCRGGRPSRSSTAAAEAVTLRRLERMKDLADLITREKLLIMELSSTLTGLQSTAKAATTGKSTKSSSVSGASACINEASVVDLNLRFLLACQRRQALLEELGLLHKGSPVLVPPMRGEPLRARLQLHAVRVALKPLACDSGDGGGYVVVGMGERLRTVDGGRPVKYHILAVLKCVGEGRIYHTQTVTLMRVADLPPGTVRRAHFVDLVADIDIVPLRADFVINIEVYCLETGGSGGIGSAGVVSGGGASMDRHQSSGLQTPVSRKANSSVMEKSPIISSAKKCGGFHMSSLLLSAKKRKYYVSKPKEETDLSAAFTLLSSVSLRHHDDLLFGRLPRARRGAVGGADENITGCPRALTEAEGGGERGEAAMPLYLEGLPRSSPLAGPLGLSDITVRLQSAVLKRGFLTVFDESGGMGVWTRCWCKLSVDQLVCWRYPEDEIEAAVAWPSAAAAAAAPVGRLDLRRVVAPWAVQAPRKICVRANTLYMRSLVAVNAKLLLSDTAPCGDGARFSMQSSVTASSILLRASPDYKWMEQRHLMCADSEAEMESWVKELNGALEVLQHWMPEHFARLARYDSGLTFTQPVAASVASRLKQW